MIQTIVLIVAFITQILYLWKCMSFCSVNKILNLHRNIIAGNLAIIISVIIQHSLTDYFNYTYVNIIYSMVRCDIHMTVYSIAVTMIYTFSFEYDTQLLFLILLYNILKRYKYSSLMILFEFTIRFDIINPIVIGNLILLYVVLTDVYFFDLMFNNRKRVVIGFFGEKGTGKNTATQYLVDKYGFRESSFSEPLKLGIMKMCNMTYEQVFGNNKEKIDTRWGFSPRYILQFVGTDLFRNQIRDDFWILNFQQRLLRDPHTNYAIEGCRFQNELESIHEMHGLCIKLVRNVDKKQDTHSSELGVSSLQGLDFVIENNATVEELYEKIDWAVKSTTTKNKFQIQIRKIYKIFNKISDGRK